MPARKMIMQMALGITATPRGFHRGNRMVVIAEMGVLPDVFTVEGQTIGQDIVF